MLNKSEAKKLIAAKGKRMSAGILDHIEADIIRRINSMCEKTGPKTISISDAVLAGGFVGAKKES